MARVVYFIHGRIIGVAPDEDHPRGQRELRMHWEKAAAGQRYHAFENRARAGIVSFHEVTSIKNGKTAVQGKASVAGDPLQDKCAARMPYADRVRDRATGKFLKEPFGYQRGVAPDWDVD